MELTCAGRTAVVIPAYKPDDRLPPYVQALKDAGIGRIVVVDDGSGQDYQRFFDQIPRDGVSHVCLLYTSPSPRDKRQSRMPSSA